MVLGAPGIFRVFLACRSHSSSGFFKKTGWDRWNPMTDPPGTNGGALKTHPWMFDFMVNDGNYTGLMDPMGISIHTKLRSCGTCVYIPQI